MTSSSEDRFARQSGLLPTARLRATHATVIGVGAVGRQVALQLASLGVGRLQLIDPDTVERTNVTTQGYCAADVGRLKVEATSEACRAIEPGLPVDAVADRFRSALRVGDAVFCCVDSISDRAAIWRSVRDRCPFWCDGRVRGEVIRVLAATDDASRQAYAESLFPQREAQSGPCTARGVIYTAAVAAGLMVNAFSRWMRDQPVEEDVALNLLAMEMVVDISGVCPRSSA